MEPAVGLCHVWMVWMPKQCWWGLFEHVPMPVFSINVSCQERIRKGKSSLNDEQNLSEFAGICAYGSSMCFLPALLHFMQTGLKGMEAVLCHVWVPKQC